MAEGTPHNGQVCTLVYDGQCRLCVTAKDTLERLGSEPSRSPVRMIPYQSEEAKHLLGDSYRPGRPDVAFLVDSEGQITRGVDAFLPLLPGLTGGHILAFLFRMPLVKPLACLLYPVLARWRYRLFGEVPLEDCAGRPKSAQDCSSPR